MDINERVHYEHLVKHHTKILFLTSLVNFELEFFVPFSLNEDHDDFFQWKIVEQHSMEQVWNVHIYMVELIFSVNLKSILVSKSNLCNGLTESISQTASISNHKVSNSLGFFPCVWTFRLNKVLYHFEPANVSNKRFCHNFIPTFSLSCFLYVSAGFRKIWLNQKLRFKNFRKWNAATLRLIHVHSGVKNVWSHWTCNCTLFTFLSPSSSLIQKRTVSSMTGCRTLAIYNKCVLKFIRMPIGTLSIGFLCWSWS